MTFRWGEALKGGIPGERGSPENLLVMAAPPQDGPRGAQDGPRGPQDGQRVPHDDPKGSQKDPQEGPERHPSLIFAWY